MKTVAGIDLGTQSMKVVIYDYENHNIIEKASCPVELISADDGTREQKTEWFDEALKVCFEKLSAENKSTIEAIGVSGQQHGFVPLAADGSPLYNIKLWCDTSTTAECEEITAKVGGKDAVINAIDPKKAYWIYSTKNPLAQEKQKRCLGQLKIHYASTRLFELETHW